MAGSACPPSTGVFDNDLIIGAALTMYAIEFIADKIPWVDSIWDAVHTVIRPLGGALIAVQTLGDASPATEDPRRPARRHPRGRHASHQGRDPGRCQHQP